MSKVSRDNNDIQVQMYRQVEINNWKYGLRLEQEI